VQRSAIESACKQHKPKAVYLIPTLHNPTTATLSPSRRKAIADIIRNSGTFLIEDDAYGLLEPQTSPIANLIPERTPRGQLFEVHRATHWLRSGIADQIIQAIRNEAMGRQQLAAKS